MTKIRSGQIGTVGDAWQTWVPTYSASGSGTYTGVTTNVARFQQVGKTVYFVLDATGTIGGTPGTGIIFTAPVNRQGTISNQGVAASGRIDNAITEVPCITWNGANQSQIAIQRSNFANFVSGGGNIHISGMYEAA